MPPKKDHSCNQWDRIATLETNQSNFMEILKEVKDDVKDIKKYLFEWWLEEHYAKRDSVKRLWAIVWWVISFVFIALGWIVIAMIKYFLSLNIK